MICTSWIFKSPSKRVSENWKKSKNDVKSSVFVVMKVWLKDCTGAGYWFANLFCECIFFLFSRRQFLHTSTIVPTWQVDLFWSIEPKFYTFFKWAISQQCILNYFSKIYQLWNWHKAKADAETSNSTLNYETLWNMQFGS